jgi:dipeptidyl aminopeptidase/acylaminoacyl peptidase
MIRTLLRSLCIPAALGVVALCAPAASASFAGANGELALQPMSGSGVLLASASGHGHRLICATNVACQTATDPRWSPDGRELVVTHNKGAAWSIVASDGTCVNCENITAGAGRATFTNRPGQLTSVDATTFLSFGSDGRQLSFLGKGGAPLRPAPNDSTINSHVSNSDWSSNGELAVVRSGEVYAGTPGHLRRVGAGTQPSWSPNTRRIAMTDHGQIVLHTIANGAETRLARGSSPAWSPDGRQVAYLSAQHSLKIITLASHRVTVVPHVRGRTVDWGPAPAGPPGCQLPPHSQTVLVTPTTIVTADTATTDSSETNTYYSACLIADGQTRTLTDLPIEEDSDTLGGVAAAGTDVALIDNYVSHYGDGTSAVRVYNLLTGAPAPGIELPECSATFSCSVTGNDLVFGSDGVIAFHVTTNSVEENGPVGGQNTEQIVSLDASGTQVRDTVGPETPQSPPALTGLALTGNVLTWDRDGVPQTVTLTPTG